MSAKTQRSQGSAGLSIRAAASESRAREPYSAERMQQLLACKDLADRVELICAWMAKGWYQPGDWKPLARVWGVSESAVGTYAAEARRMLARELLAKSRDELLAELLARISFLGQDSLERTEEVALQSGAVVEVRRPDHRTALRAAEATGELLGLKVQRHHHVVTAGEMTTEQIIEQLRAQGVRVELPVLTSGETVEEHGDEKAKKEAGGSGEPSSG